MDEGGCRDGASLSEEAPWRGPRRGGSFNGNPGRYVKKVSGCGHLSPWGPLSTQGEPGMWRGGSYTGVLGTFQYLNRKFGILKYIII